jgi:hypothetical protein
MCVMEDGILYLARRKGEPEPPISFRKRIRFRIIWLKLMLPVKLRYWAEFPCHLFVRLSLRMKNRA